MSGAPITAAARLEAALSHRESDRVPFFLPAGLHGARLLGVPLPRYLASAELMVAGQLRLRELVGHDAVSCFVCAAAEVEAFGGELRVFEDGPPNAGEPPLRTAADLERLVPPEPEASPALRRSLALASGLRARVGDAVPILAGTVGPLSLPAMQVGVGRWLELLDEAPGLAARLLRVNEVWCARLANAFLAAGAGVVAVAEPLASPAMLPLARWRAIGMPVLARAIAAVRGPVAVSTASAICGPVAADLAAAGAVAVGVSESDDLAAVKDALRGRAVVMGNLNGLAMRRWTDAAAEEAVRAAIAAAGAGGGFVLSEHHGEVPFQVPERVLEAVGDAVRRCGAYPLAGGEHAR